MRQGLPDSHRIIDHERGGGHQQHGDAGQHDDEHHFLFDGRSVRREHLRKAMPLLNWQGEIKTRAAVQTRFIAAAAALQFHQPLHDGQTQTPGSIRFIQSVKRLK